jgi:hypothetical protein
MTGAKKSTAVTIGFIVILFFADTGYAQKRPCTDAEARAALDEAVTLRSWDALLRATASLLLVIWWTTGILCLDWRTLRRRMLSSVPL